MTEDNELKYFITESLFLVNEPGLVAEKKTVPAESPIQKETEPSPAKATELTPTIPKVNQPEAPAAPKEVHELMVLVFPMNSQDEELLNNLLKAIKKTRADIKLINSFSDFDTNFEKLLSFGYLNELKAKVDTGITEFVNTSWDNKNVLVSLPLSALHNNNTDKGRLWKALQEKFL